MRVIWMSCVECAATELILEGKYVGGVGWKHTKESKENLGLVKGRLNSVN